MFHAQSSPLFAKQNIAVSSNGEIVLLQIGNAEFAVHYEQALDLSKWIRQEAAAIKCGTGRIRTSRGLGTLVDATANGKPLPYASGTAIHVKQKQHHWHREDVWAEGRLVATKIGYSTFRLHFESALKISQWLRLRAKEARNRAGDNRHWSEIGSLEDLE